MRFLSLAVLLALSACTTTRDQPRGPGYVLTEDGDGDMTISVDPDNPEALMAALQDAAGRLDPWSPPVRAGGLVRQDSMDLGQAGTVYRYGYGTGRMDVYVYRLASDVDAQVEETESALDQLVQRGRIDAFRIVDRSEASLRWRGTAIPLHVVTLEETIDGQAWASYMYLLQDRGGWVKVRASHPARDRTRAEVDRQVRALLGEA